MTRPRTWKRTAVRALVAIGGVLVLATGLIGFAHTKAGRPYLAMLTGVGCPLGLDAKLDPAQRDAARREVLASRWGGGPAPTRDAFGFVLGQTTRADVTAWAARDGITCKPGRKKVDLVCDGSPAGESAGVSPADTTRMVFDASEKLIAVSVVRSHLDPDQAARVFAHRTDALAQTYGAPTSTRGEGTASYLGAGALQQANVAYRFSDAAVELRATNLGNGRVSLSEEIVVPPTT